MDRQLGRRGCRREGLAVSPPVERRGLPALHCSLMPGKFFIVSVSLRVTADAGVGIVGRYTGLVPCLPPEPITFSLGLSPIHSFIHSLSAVFPFCFLYRQPSVAVFLSFLPICSPSLCPPHPYVGVGLWDGTFQSFGSGVAGWRRTTWPPVV